MTDQSALGSRRCARSCSDGSLRHHRQRSAGDPVQRGRQRAAAFYTRLGFTEVFRVPDSGPPIHVDLILDGYRIGFASVASSREDHGLDPSPSGTRATITLWTEDTAAAYRTLTAVGVPGLAEPSVWLDRLLIAWIADPDGHAIQLVQRLAG